MGQSLFSPHHQVSVWQRKGTGAPTCGKSWSHLGENEMQWVKGRSQEGTVTDLIQDGEG